MLTYIKLSKTTKVIKQSVDFNCYYKFRLDIIQSVILKQLFTSHPQAYQIYKALGAQ